MTKATPYSVPMPHRAPHPCVAPGCKELIPGTSRNGRCPSHRRARHAAIDTRRGSAASRGYDHRWRLARANFLARHPLCAMCHAARRVVPATVVDHITPHRGDMAIFWDTSNWQALCAPCHGAKTVREGLGKVLDGEGRAPGEGVNPALHRQGGRGEGGIEREGDRALDRAWVVARTPSKFATPFSSPTDSAPVSRRAR